MIDLLSLVDMDDLSMILIYLFQQNDIIITADANVFVMSYKLLDPIYENLAANIWVYHGQEKADAQEGLGLTFNMNMIATTKNMWEKIIEPNLAPSRLLGQEWVNRKVEQIGLMRAG